ncbi:rac GTPase-activating protein 1-like [Bombina bombina]|uniref:rac GTPase-activating protein 1-like n=1 Tax=Bombina bombina TaxID=8345 RepID=UPI00235ACE0B|nr:rac GTPase-activating protein 1-like [Bombina bombina]
MDHFTVITPPYQLHFHLIELSQHSGIGDARKRALQSYLDRLLKVVEFNAKAEEEFIQVAQSFDVSRRKWQQSEVELREKREVFVKCEIERSALQVKLKHARNQVDVEMKKRHRAEAELEKVERQMHLIGDILMSDGHSAVPFSESMLAFFGGGRSNNAANGAGNRMSMVEESCTSFLSHSDISYDQTEDDMYLDEFVGRPTKLKGREKRRSSLSPLIAPLLAVKRSRPSEAAAVVSENVKDTVMARTSMIITEGGPIHAVSTIEAKQRRRSRKSRTFSPLSEQTSVLPQINEAEQELEPETVPSPPSNSPAKPHTFISKTVIRSELCTVCGKKTRFGKMYLKCRDCRILLHPECRDYCSNVCSSKLIQNIRPKNGQGVLADFAPTTSPRIPSLVIQCVHEIEKRGLSERGIYRVPGCDRIVKDLKQKILQGKATAQQLGREDVHAVCGVLKDFLRNLKEPLLTFTLHSQFLEAADIIKESDSKAEICQAVHELPAANRETLAFLILHLHRVMQSTECKMDKMSLSRVFGPTVVGHSVPEPNPLMIMQDTPRQAKVMSLFLSLSCGFWSQFLTNDENKNCSSVNLAQERLFRPLTSPEINSFLSVPLNTKGPSPYLTQSNSKSELPRKAGRFFTSPNS